MPLGTEHFAPERRIALKQTRLSLVGMIFRIMTRILRQRKVPPGLGLNHHWQDRSPGGARAPGLERPLESVDDRSHLCAGFAGIMMVMTA